MKTITVKLKKYSYKIIIGRDIMPSLGRYICKLKIGDSAYIITNTAIKRRYASILSRALKGKGFNCRFKLIPDSEKSKSFTVANEVIQDIAHYDKKRSFFIIAFGGGVIGDLAGFVSSIYKRGIPYVQLPTTLLAQVDSSIGGKTALDLNQGKNLVGAFYQPRLVFIDVTLLKTLPLRQLRAGLAEVIKYGLIKDSRLFTYLEQRHKDILRVNPAALEYIVSVCAQIKARIVQTDEREEKGIRTILNFGHTIGHAIEQAAGYTRYNHGEAVALGMLAETFISKRLKLIDNQTASRITHIIKAIGLPVKIKGISPKDVLTAHYHDKKFKGPQNRFVLIEGIGKAKIVKNIPLKIIQEGLKEIFL